MLKLRLIQVILTTTLCFIAKATSYERNLKQLPTLVKEFEEVVIKPYGRLTSNSQNEKHIRHFKNIYVAKAQKDYAKCGNSTKKKIVNAIDFIISSWQRSRVSMRDWWRDLSQSMKFRRMVRYYGFESVACAISYVGIILQQVVLSLEEAKLSRKSLKYVQWGNVRDFRMYDVELDRILAEQFILKDLRTIFKHYAPKNECGHVDMECYGMITEIAQDWMKSGSCVQRWWVEACDHEGIIWKFLHPTERMTVAQARSNARLAAKCIKECITRLDNHTETQHYKKQRLAMENPICTDSSDFDSMRVNLSKDSE